MAPTNIRRPALPKGITQIEVAAMLKGAPEPELARNFMNFILEDGVSGGDSDDKLDVSCRQGGASRRL